MKMMNRHVVVLLAALLVSVPALAQQPASPAVSDPTAATEQADKIVVPVFPLTAAQLQQDTPLPVNFNLGFSGRTAIDGIDPTLTEGVVAQGFARKVMADQDGQKIPYGQVAITAVSKGEKVEVIDQTGLTASFEKEEDTLFPEDEVQVSGSKTALIDALKRLQGTAAKEPEKSDENEAGDDAKTGASTEKSNDLASSWQAPTDTPTIQADPVISSKTTTEGCEVRVDLEKGVAIPQARTETYSDGTLTSAGTCADTASAGYQLSKSYAACSDLLDFKALTATARYQMVYVDKNAETHVVSDCTADPQAVYPLKENTAACPVSLEWDSKKAVPQSTLFYVNRAEEMVQARGCAPSLTVAAVAMTQDSTACPLRHDFDGETSWQMAMWTYTLNGKPFQASACVDTQTNYPHSTVTSANGDYICPTIVNAAARTVIIQGRTQITVDGQPKYISECAPLETATQTTKATTDGCLDVSAWTHDIAAAVSYGQERFYYTKPDGSPVYVTTCQTNSTSYPHSYTPVGWENHDESLFAYRVMKVSISVNGVMREVAPGQVLPGSAHNAYLLEGTDVNGTGELFYDGCKKYEKTQSVELWRRPDSTVYNHPIGVGPAENKGDACTYKNPDVLNDWTVQPNTPWNPTQCTYTGYRTVTREDGVLISKDKATIQKGSVITSDGGVCVSHPEAADVAAVFALMGW